MLKTINNLEVPSDWKNTLISQLKHSEPNCSAAPLFENIKTIQMKDNILVSPVGRRRSKNHIHLKYHQPVHQVHDQEGQDVAHLPASRDGQFRL